MWNEDRLRMIVIEQAPSAIRRAIEDQGLTYYGRADQIGGPLNEHLFGAESIHGRQWDITLVLPTLPNEEPRLRIEVHYDDAEEVATHHE